MKIYTKTGDKGETGLVGGLRVSKASIRLETYGGVDELNSHLGLLSSFLKSAGQARDATETLRLTQQALFTLGSNLACESKSREKFKLPQLQDEDISRLEEKIDEYEKCLEPLKNFILPNGAPAAASAHVARAVCRRVERTLVLFSKESAEEVPERAGKLLNRLSDYLFVLARHINKSAGESETVWKA